MTKRKQQLAAGQSYMQGPCSSSSRSTGQVFYMMATNCTSPGGKQLCSILNFGLSGMICKWLDPLVDLIWVGFTSTNHFGGAKSNSTCPVNFPWKEGNHKEMFFGQLPSKLSNHQLKGSLISGAVNRQAKQKFLLCPIVHPQKRLKRQS